MKGNKLKDESGNLVISLDFELLWGIFDKVDYSNSYDYFINTRNAIPKILNLFEKYEVCCTWAVVGMLFNSSWDEWEENIPKSSPSYKNPELSAYKFGNSIKNKATENLCFAPDLVKMIVESPDQELGTHTYSHYYCKENGQNLESFKADLEMAKGISKKKYNTDLESMVFPRNQINLEYLNVCQNLGLKSVRSNPEVWYWRNTQKDSLAQKVFRTGDAYFGLNDKPYAHSDLRKKNGIMLQPASRLLRPYSENKIPRGMRMKRIKNEMTFAAQNGKIYHLWWHPHNFGSNPQKSLNELESILRHFMQCRNKFDFSSKTMKKLYAEF